MSAGGDTPWGGRTRARRFDRDARRRLVLLAELVEEAIEHHADVTQLRALIERPQRP